MGFFSPAILRLALGNNMLVTAEPVALRGTTPRALLRPINAIKRVYSFTNTDTIVEYVEGVDYELIDGKIARKSGSAIYDFDTYEIDPNGATPPYFNWRSDPRNPPRTLLLCAQVDYFTERQIEIIKPLSPVPFTGKIAAAGDSITSAADTVSIISGLPEGDRDGFTGLIRAYFGEQITSLTNVGVDGTAIGSLAPAIEDVLDTQDPDTLMLNFGMNDHYDGPTTSFETDMQTVITATKARGKRVFMTGFFHRNPYSAGIAAYNANNVERFVNAQRNLARANGLSYADVNTLWKRAMKRKSTEEMLGDNFHHPGNYGHRIYFSAILPHLLTEPISSEDVPAYIVMPKDL